MTLIDTTAEPIDLQTTPLHLGLGSRARPVLGFAWEPEVLQSYIAAVAADGPEGRLVVIVDADGPGDHWERHPAGDEVVVCLSGQVTVVRGDDEGSAGRVALGPGQAPGGASSALHAANSGGPARDPTFTPDLGAEHRPRT